MSMFGEGVALGSRLLGAMGTLDRSGSGRWAQGWEEQAMWSYRNPEFSFKACAFRLCLQFHWNVHPQGWRQGKSGSHQTSESFCVLFGWELRRL